MRVSPSSIHLKQPLGLLGPPLGDWQGRVQPAETIASRTLAGGDRLAAGFFLSVSCTEDVPFLPKDWTPLTTGTFGADYRLRQQSNACAEWPRGVTPPEHRQPVQVEISRRC